VIVVDTTVLVFAVGADHPHVEPSRRLLQAVAAGDVHATTTYEVIRGFAHVRARRRGRSDARRLARSFAQLLAPLLAFGDGDLDLGLRLFERHEQLGAFDAFLAAAALRHDASTVVSADSGFSAVRELEHVEPTEEAIERLLA